jgi:hypothetical protein
MDSRVNDIAKVHAIYNNASLLHVHVQMSSSLQLHDNACPRKLLIVQLIHAWRNE